MTMIIISWPEFSLSKCSEFNAENPVVRQLDLLAALKVLEFYDLFGQMYESFFDSCKKFSATLPVNFDGEHLGPDEGDLQRRELRRVRREARVLQHHWQKSLRKVFIKKKSKSRSKCEIVKIDKILIEM